VEDVVLAARQLGFRRIAITTNGTLPLGSTADILFVSFDGMRDVHEEIRGPIWVRVMLNLAESQHPRTFAQITISQANWRDIPELVRFLSGVVSGITCQFYYPYPGSEDFWLPWPERRWVLDQLRELKRQGYPIAHSERVLRELAEPGWRCRDWLVANAEPDPDLPGAAILRSGCYLNGRASSNCDECGFAAHTELSRAYELVPGALWTGQEVFNLAWRPSSRRLHA
jgi:MoaA/NifB/PqqE/SkfB family radical SAM enzyme